MTEIVRKKIAVIGTGISGLGVASLLHKHHDITVYEKNDYVGGHSRTIDVRTKDGIIPVDTGFIVFNKRNYPLLTRLFEHLNVPIAESDMSFGASIDHGRIEYGTQGLINIFAQRRNILRPAFLRMILDILKFNKVAGNYLSHEPSFTLGECLDELNMHPWFRDYFLLSMGGAIWSTPAEEMLKFPASTFIRFFENHGLLTVNDQPQWYTVRDGSREYIRRLTDPFKHNIYTNRGVRRVLRGEHGVMIEDVRGERHHYDDAILSCHADQAIDLIDGKSEEEKDVLSAFKYQKNRAVLHGDTSFMPKCRKAWASWVYLSERGNDQNPRISLSYWMNNLQPLQTDHPLIVTLNPGKEPDQNLIYNDFTFEHPVFDAEAIENQSKLDDIQGKNRLWFCGAYQRYGFHEDGLGSAVKVAARMGISPPW